MKFEEHLREAMNQSEALINRQEEWELEDEMTEIHYTNAEIVAQMARRLAYQTRLMDEEARMVEIVAKCDIGKLPRRWVGLAKEWCDAHWLAVDYGIMALLHYKSMFGTDVSELNLWEILDDAFEEAKKIKFVV